MNVGSDEYFIRLERQYHFRKDDTIAAPSYDAIYKLYANNYYTTNTKTALCSKKAMQQIFETDSGGEIKIVAEYVDSDRKNHIIKLNGYGYIFNTNEIIRILDDFSESLSNICELPAYVTPCPHCLARYDDNPGIFTIDIIKRLSMQTDVMSDIICNRGCSVPIDHIIDVRKLEDSNIKLQDLNSKVQFLMDEIIIKASVDSSKLKKSVVRLHLGYALKTDIDTMKKKSLNRPHKLLKKFIFHPMTFASGIIVSLDDGRKFVVSSQHAIPATPVARAVEGILGLIGDETNFFYTCKPVIIGSDHHQNWDIAAFELIVPILPISLLRISSTEVVVTIKDDPLVVESIPITDNPTVSDNELLRLLAYPYIKKCQGHHEDHSSEHKTTISTNDLLFTIDWGRCYSSELEINGKFIVNFNHLTNCGASGGPIVARNGVLVGLVKGVHQTLGFGGIGTYVEPIRNLKNLLCSL